MLDITQTLKDLKEKGVLEILIEYRCGGDSGEIDYTVYKPQNLDNYVTHDQTEADELICFVDLTGCAQKQLVGVNLRSPIKRPSLV